MISATPPAYAATVDEGEIGRTAFEQARRYKHMAIAGALK
jgi:hypothetical protein